MSTSITCPRLQSQSSSFVTVCGFYLDKFWGHFIVSMARNDFSPRAETLERDSIFRSQLITFLKETYNINEEAFADFDYSDFPQEVEDILFSVGDRFIEEWEEKRRRIRLISN